MTLVEFKKQQKEYLKAFKKLMKEDPDKAKRIAFRDLHAAGIVDKSGALTKHYR